MAHKIYAPDSPKPLILAVSCELFLWMFKIITISTVFNKHKKQSSKTVKNVENIYIFQLLIKQVYFSTICIKHPENQGNNC